MFSNEDIVYTYSTKQAIEDGYLVEIPKSTYSRAGITFPVLVTHDLYEEIASKSNEDPAQTYILLKKMLFVFVESVNSRRSEGGEIIFEFPVDKQQTLRSVKVQVRQFDFDDARPAYFFMLPNED